MNKVITYVDAFVTGYSRGASITIGTAMLIAGVKGKALDKKSRAYLVTTGGAMLYTNVKSYVADVVQVFKELKAECETEEEMDWREVG